VTSTLSVFRHALIFGLAPVLQRLIALLLVPYFTHYIDEAEYGLRDLLVAITGFFPVLFTFQYRTGFIRSYVGLESHRARCELLSATMALMGGLAVLASLCFFFLWRPIFELAGAPEVSPFFRVVLTAGIFLEIVIGVLTSVAQAELWSGRLVVLNLVQFTVGLLLNIWFVVGMELGALGLFLGFTLSSLVFLAGLLWIARGLFTRELRLSRALDACREPLLYSLPLWGGSLAYFVVRYVERFVIPDADSIDALGIYGVAWKLSNLLPAFLLEPFLRSFDVWRFKVYGGDGEVGIISNSYRLFMLVAGLATVGVATFGVDVYLRLADERYAGAAVYVPWLNAGILLQCAYSITSSSFFVTARTGQWMKLFVVAAVLQVVGCRVLVGWLGTEGAPLAMIVTNSFLYAGAVAFGGRLWRVPYRHGQAIGVIVLVTLLSMVRQSLEAESWVVAFAVDAALVVAYVGVVTAAGWVAVEELKRGTLRGRAWLVAGVRRVLRGGGEGRGEG